MPSKGIKQKPAGVDKSPHVKDLGTRSMDSRNSMIKTSLRIADVKYVSNAVLNAEKE